MKNTAKWLSLLLAGMTAASLFAACAEFEATDGERFNASDYENLTPAEAYRALCDVSEASMTVHIRYENGGQSEDVVYTEKRDGDLLEETADDQNEDAADAAAYYDLGKGIGYTQTDGEWQSGAVDGAVTWKGIVDLYFDTHAYGIFGDDSRFEKDGAHYTITDEAADAFGEGNAPLEQYFGADYEIRKATVEVNGTEYTYTVEAGSNETEAFRSVEIAVVFADQTLTLPEGIGGEETAASSVTTAATTPAATTSAPVTDSPNPPEPPVVAMGLMSPASLLRTLRANEDATVELHYKDENGAQCEEIYEKDGDTVKWQSTVGSEEATVYYDLGEQMTYYRQDGEWYKSAGAPTWDELLDSFDAKYYTLLSTPDNRYIYKTSTNEYQLSEGTASSLGLSSAALSYTEHSGEYVFSLVSDSNLASSIEFSLYVWDALSLPDAREDETVGRLLAPSALYEAIVSAEDLTITAIADGMMNICVKDGNRLSVFSGDINRNGQTVYVDLVSGMAYKQDASGAWLTSEDNSWEDVLTSMGLTPETDVFIDSYYDPFGKNDTTLEMAGSTDEAYGQLERSESVYTVITYADGILGTVGFSFAATEVTFPSFN